MLRSTTWGINMKYETNKKQRSAGNARKGFRRRQIDKKLESLATVQFQIAEAVGVLREDMETQRSSLLKVSIYSGLVAYAVSVLTLSLL